jgi:hypothetical protein
MKKVFLILGVLISIHMETKAQQVNPLTASVEKNTFSMYSPGYNGPDRDADFYLHRSRKQRTVGWITLGAGIVLSGVGLLITDNNSLGTWDYNGNYHEDNGYTAGIAMTIIGAASGIVSIPFMIMASANKHKATLMLKNQSAGFVVPPVMSRNIPGISLSVQLGK